MKKKRRPPVRPRVRPHGRCRARGGVRGAQLLDQPAAGPKTPPWRSKFIVGLGGGGFMVLLGRALYIQVLGNDFFQKQGEIRFARNIDLPPAAAASSTATARSWPSACRRRRSGRSEGSRGRPQAAPPAGARAGHEQRRARRAPAAPPELRWLRRQVDEQVGRTCRARPQGACTRSASTSASTPRARPRARGRLRPTPTSAGQEGVEFALRARAAGNDGKRRVIGRAWAASSRTSAKASSRWTAATCA